MTLLFRNRTKVVLTILLHWFNWLCRLIAFSALLKDGAPPFFGVQVRNFLNDTFPYIWIGVRGDGVWPACSPDFTPVEFLYR